MGRLTRVLLCGFGRFGAGAYARRVLEHDDLDLVGVVELPAAFERVRAAGLRPFDTLREALDVTRPRLVLVATTPESHALLATEALTRHCDVILAKPGALNLDEATRIATTAWRLGRRVFVDYTPLESAGWRDLVSKVTGEIVTARFVRRGPASLQACGALWDLAPHDVALAVNLNPTDKVVAVTASAWHFDGLDEPAGAFIHLAHYSGRTSRIEVDWLAPYPERRVEVLDESGVLAWDAIADADDRRDDVSLMLDRVVRGIRTWGDDDSGRFLEVTRIIEAAEISMHYRSTVSLDARVGATFATSSVTTT